MDVFSYVLLVSAACGLIMVCGSFLLLYRGVIRLESKKGTTSFKFGELVQIGNCGPPIELDEGWLLLTHGVGAMRKYSIGAVLLDKEDPSKVIGRTKEPLLAAANQDREGYVPNVVYTCGAIRHGDRLFVPYGVADSSVAFAFIPISELLAAM